MVRDTAYGSLLKSRRRDCIARSRTPLSEKFAARAEAEPEVLAYHLTEAGVRGSRCAGVAARSRSIGCARRICRGRQSILARGRGFNDDAETDARNERELALLISLGRSSRPPRAGFARSRAIFRRARELDHGLGRGRKAAILGLWQTYLTRGELAAAQTLAEERLEFASVKARHCRCAGDISRWVRRLFHQGKYP